jgi:hypothetical protein
MQMRRWLEFGYTGWPEGSLLCSGGRWLGIRQRSPLGEALGSCYLACSTQRSMRRCRSWSDCLQRIC